MLTAVQYILHDHQEAHENDRKYYDKNLPNMGSNGFQSVY